MAKTEYFIDEPSFPWAEVTRPDRIGRGFSQKLMAKGKDGEPYYVIGRQPEGFSNPAHSHSQDQFQIVLKGGLSFPKHPMSAISVHYSDAFTPYGPFIVGKDMELSVVRPKEAEQYYMSDPKGRKLVNRSGRELYGEADKISWEKVGGGVERKALFGDGKSQPQAEIRKYPAGSAITRPPAPFGRFHILIEGSAKFGTKKISPRSVVFDKGEGWETPFIAGEKGATVLDLAFDRGQ